MTLAPGLMICGTSSDSGKSTVVAGMCRLLARRGLKVAPFKAQNMALNSTVTAEGHEIGRAQAAQAAAAMVEPEAAMNPILLKPTSHRHSQVVVMGRPWLTLDAASYQSAKPQLWEVVRTQLQDLRGRFDVVVCEGAGSPAEINLLDGDIVNLRVAHDAGIPALLVGDIDRGGLFASLYGTVELLPSEWKPLVRGFIINKFRGDPDLLRGGPEEIHRRTGIPTLGVLPWLDGIGLDAEDSLALRARLHERRNSRRITDVLDVAVVRLPRISNFTDFDALGFEAGVHVRMVDSPAALGRPALVIIPGTKSTIADLEWLRETGFADLIADIASGPDPRTTILGICGGYQMLGEKISDDGIEQVGRGTVPGLGLLPVETEFHLEKTTRRVTGNACGERFEAYEIHHGITQVSRPWIELDGIGAEGARSRSGRVLGCSLHGMFESDSFRRAFLRSVSGTAGASWQPGTGSFAAAREERFERLADVLDAHVDIAAIDRLIEVSRR